MTRESQVETLKQEVASGRAVIVAGTGVSRAACGDQKVGGFSVSTWPGLIAHGARHCLESGLADADEFEIVDRQLSKGNTRQLIAAAQDVSQRMLERSQGFFRGWLLETLGQLRLTDPALPAALACLPGVLATLNYDGLLEQASRRKAVTWRQPDAVQELLRGNGASGVLHLHGWLEDPESVVLGLDSYLAVKTDPHAETVLRTFVLDRTLVFVGCGDTVLDPNFTHLIQWARKALEQVRPRHYLLCRKSQLGEFRDKLRDAPWLQPLDYGSEYSDLLPFIQALESHARPSPSVPHSVGRNALDLEGYRQAMRKFYGRLKLEELDPTSHDATLSLTSMFIPQSARECVDFLPRVFDLPKELQQQLSNDGELLSELLDAEVLTRHRQGYLAQPAQPILELVQEQQLGRLVVLGDPGSGKSTLLQYLVLQWVDNEGSGEQRGPLPLLIDLRDYARLRQAGQLHDFIAYLHRGSSAPWHFDRSALEAWLETEPSLWLFDGLDEVFDSALRREVATAIQRLADKYPHGRTLVTSRVIGFQHRVWRDRGFRLLMLQDLNLEQRETFLQRWHERAYEVTSRGKEKYALLSDSIRLSPAIRQLAGNPLLLTMMAILNRTQDLPRDRSELYDQCARLLLHQWKVDLAFAQDPELAKASLDFKDKRLLLMRVARAMQETAGGLAGNLIEEGSLEEALAAALTGVPNLAPQRAARALIDQLRGRNFMLSSLGGRAYAFVHRTFLEYFCALEIRERFQTEQTLTLEQLQTEIFGRWREDAWHEVLCLLAGMLAPRFVGEVLDFLLRQQNPASGRAVLLAGACVKEVRKLDALGAADTRVLEALKALGGVHRDPYAVDLVASVWRCAPGTYQWLVDLVKSDAVAHHAALHRLAAHWRDPQTINFILAEVGLLSDEDAWRMARGILRMAWADDPALRALLEARFPYELDARVQAPANSVEET